MSSPSASPPPLAIRFGIVIAALLWLGILPGLAQQTVYVDDDNCPGPGSGTVGDPFCKINDAVCDIKDAGGTVLVRPGHYNESVRLFPGTSIISTDGPAVTTIDGAGQVCLKRDCQPNPNSPTCSTVFISQIDGVGPTPDDRLEGFRITGGQGFFRDLASPNPDMIVGGGVFVFGNSAPTITHNEIVGNALDHPTAQLWYGGGIYIHSTRPQGGSPGFNPARPMITNNLIENNVNDPPAGASGSKTTYALGGGIYVGYHTYPTIDGNTIRNNRSGDTAKINQFATGGGITMYSLADIGGSPTITRNLITGNNGTDLGGGIASGPRFDPELGAFVPSAGTVENNVIEFNDAGEGGGIQVNTSLVMFRNNTIVDNVAEFGGGISVGVSENPGDDPSIVNSLVVFNAADYGGGLYVYRSQPVVRYTDLYGNIYVDVGGEKTDADYLGVEANVSVDPSFVNGRVDSPSGVAFRSLRLQNGSPVVDVGAGTATSEMDFDGAPRVADGDNDGTAVIDLGAFELESDFDLDGVPDSLDPDDDNDGVPDALDCAPLDASASRAPAEVSGVVVDHSATTTVSWVDAGIAATWDVVGGSVTDLLNNGDLSGAGCLADDAASSSWEDTRPDPAVGDGHYYLIRGQNVCGDGSYGDDSSATPRSPPSGCP